MVGRGVTIGLVLAALLGGLLAARVVVGALARLVQFGGLLLVSFLVAYALYDLRCRLRGG